MLSKNKRGQLPEFISLFFATIIIAVMLILFMVTAGIIKAFDKASNGEKIFNSDDVGVGDIKDSMKDYSRFIEAESLIRKGEDVERALDIKKYGKKPDINIPYYYGGKIEYVGVYYGS